MRINLASGPLLITIEETMCLLSERRILVCAGNQLTLTATAMTPPIAQSLVGGATTEEEALDIQRESNPDLLIVSEYLETGYGTRLIERAKKYNPDLTALIFLSRETPEVAREAMDAGADGIMFVSSIGTGRGDFVNALRTTAKGGVFVPQSVRNALRTNNPAPSLVEPLTERELEIIQCLVQGMKNTEIAEHLVISPETVKSHVSSSIHKLGVRDRVQVVAYALTYGLISM